MVEMDRKRRSVLSTMVVAHWDGNERRFLQSTATVVVVIGVGGDPKRNAQKDETGPQEGELDHGLPITQPILVRTKGFGTCFSSGDKCSLIGVATVGESSHSCRLYRQRRMI